MTPKHRAETEQDKAEAFMSNLYDSASERKKIELRPVERDYCYSVDDALDGYCVHAPTCPDYQHTWTGPNSSCVRAKFR